MAFTVKPTADLDEFRDAFLAIGQYFGAEPTEERLERFTRNLPLERMHAAREDGTIVGGAGVFPFEMTVPGTIVPTAGISVVGVYPTHRRRGVLRAMMKTQLEDVHERGEPLAALFASEETIYGRFGYGMAAFMGEISLPRDWSHFAWPIEREGRVRIVEESEALKAFPKVWNAVRPQVPGMFARSRAWWELRVLADPPDRRGGGGPKRFALLEKDGRPEGYAIYRHHMNWEAGVSTGRLEVIEAVALDGRPTAELWRYLLDIDWVGTITGWLLPTDHALFWLLAQPRRMKFRVGDGLWARLVDVGAALSARSYAADGRLVFDVVDSFCPWNHGRWKLEDGTAKPTKTAADLACDVTALGSVYLGGFTFAQLARVGQVEELKRGAVGRADTMFRTHRQPWCPEIF
jgi:predicted acetyltransferase